MCRHNGIIESMNWDVIVIGAGAAGLFCAAQAGQAGHRVLVLDHAKKIGEKIRISGGGRCNFTNRESGPQHFLSRNMHFAKSALARYTPHDFIALVKRHGIPFHEKHKGQLFCDDSAQQIIDLLRAECAKGAVDIRYPVAIERLTREGLCWRVETTLGAQVARHVVIATGGLPVPAIGASGFGLDIAREFGLPVVAPQPALVPLALTAERFESLVELAGLSVPVRIHAGQKGAPYGQASFDEDVLVTHKGLSGPAILQASSYWEEGQSLVIDWSGGADLHVEFDDAKLHAKQVESVLAIVLPERLSKVLALQAGLLGQRWAEVSKTNRQALIEQICAWPFKPAGTLGWKKAEVMRGGVDTRALDSKTMMARSVPNLYFIGECVDVTGHLGGHNFQWAWASAHACACAITDAGR
jgi:predicted Rossmann fold flavoprotein